MNLTLKTKISLAWLMVTGIFTAVISPATEIPNGGVTDGIGVNIHFIRGHERDLDLIAAAGFKFVRMDFFWTETEREKGVYDWSAYDELTKNLEQRGLCAYYIFDYSNPLYEKTSPQQPESVAAFARWAATAAKHFRGRHVIWEIWNEPNGSTFWFPKPDVKQYTTLALATAKAVRIADPQATIFAPASAGFPWPFLESFLKSGALKFLDGVSVHPYRSPQTPPETAASDYKKLRELIAANTPAARTNPIPVISGEWGYSTFIHGVDPETQAAFLARQQLANALDGVPISIWYDWKNDGNDPKENEHNFGTVRSDLTPKPAYTAIKTLTHELAGYAIQTRFTTGNLNDYVLVLTNAAGETKLAVWTLAKPHSLTLTLQPSAANEISVVNSSGQSDEITVANNQIALPLSAAPQYAALGKVHLR
jgi:hypothetical protein